METQNLLELSEQNQKRAFEIIKKLQIVEKWNAIGATANLVGSLRNGLFMKRRDIDFHIYTKNFSITDSFVAVALIASNPQIKKIDYINMLDSVDNCLEWHAWYEDENKELWQIDMIHIHNDSRYVNYFEEVADRIKAVLTPETKLAILSIKNNMTANDNFFGIEIYKAVIQDGVRNYTEFLRWRENNEPTGIIEWMP